MSWKELDEHFEWRKKHKKFVHGRFVDYVRRGTIRASEKERKESTFMIKVLTFYHLESIFEKNRSTNT